MDRSVEVACMRARIASTRGVIFAGEDADGAGLSFVLPEWHGPEYFTEVDAIPRSPRSHRLLMFWLRWHPRGGVTLWLNVGPCAESERDRRAALVDRIVASGRPFVPPPRNRVDWLPIYTRVWLTHRHAHHDVAVRLERLEACWDDFVANGLPFVTRATAPLDVDSAAEPPTDRNR